MMQSLRSVFAFLLLLFVLAPASGQADTSDGRDIVQLRDGTTLSGRLDFDPVSGHVRLTEAAVSEVHVEDILRVRSGGTWYVPTPRLTNVGYALRASPPAFLEIIVEGPVSLYATPDRVRRLLITSSQGVIELRTTDERAFDELRGEHVSMNFIDVLGRRTSDCLVTQRNIGLVSFDPASIEDHVRRYNDCVDRDAYPYRRYFSRRAVRVRISGAVSYQTSERSAATWDGLTTITYRDDPRSLIQPALAIEVHFPNDPARRFVDLQLSGRRYTFVDGHVSTSPCRWDLDCPDFLEGEYGFTLNHSEMRLTDLEATIRGFFRPTVASFFPHIGAGVVVRVPLERDISARGTRTFRRFGTNELETSPQEFELYFGRYVMASPIVSARYSANRLSLEASVMHFVRPYPRIEEVAPRSAGYASGRLSLGVTL